MSTKPLKTSDVARAVGVHPNTVRLYEEWGFLPPIPRGRNGYRRFTEAHVEQMRLARLALSYPYPGGKEPVLALVACSVAGDLGGALEQAYIYLGQIRAEIAHAEAAADLLQHWAEGGAADATAETLWIGEAAELLGLTTDTLRSWERNGLIDVPRDPDNGYRLYRAEEIARLRVIRMLRQAGYSSMAILRMMLELDQGQTEGLRQALDTPRPDEDVYVAADRWLSTLADQEERAQQIIAQIDKMIGQRRR